MEPGFGAFGKMPGLADFFRINTPAGFVSVWDDWLQEIILLGRQTLGANWDDSYLSAPIWRFTLSAGLAGPEKILGVLMSSVDTVGRQFPLTLLAPVAGESSALADHFLADTVFHELELLALDMLEDGRTRDELQARLAELPMPQSSTQTALCSNGSSLIINVGNSAGIASDLAAARFTQPSVWCTEIDGEPRTMICENMPGHNEALGLFDPNAAIWTEATPL